MLLQKQNLSDDELHSLLETQQYDEQLFYAANKVRCENYGKNVYIRGLIEISNFCKNDCYYCGIRCGNKKVLRYRLKKEDILSCCEEGYSLGFRTFVMQGGEDAYYTDERICEIVSAIKTKFADCAVTLSLGGKSHMQAIKLILMQEQTATSCATKRPTTGITANFIPKV